MQVSFSLSQRSPEMCHYALFKKVGAGNQCGEVSRKAALPKVWVPREHISRTPTPSPRRSRCFLGTVSFSPRAWRSLDSPSLGYILMPVEGGASPSLGDPLREVWGC